MSRRPFIPHQAPARRAPLTARELMAERRFPEVVHIGELHTILHPILAAHRADVTRLEQEIAELKAELGVERAERIEDWGQMAQLHLHYVAGTWEARLARRWSHMRWWVRDLVARRPHVPEMLDK